MDNGTLHVVEDGEVQNLPVFIRGNVERKGPVAPRRFLEVLSPRASRCLSPTAAAGASWRRRSRAATIR